MCGINCTISQYGSASVFTSSIRRGPEQVHIIIHIIHQIPSHPVFHESHIQPLPRSGPLPADVSDCKQISTVLIFIICKLRPAKAQTVTQHSLEITVVCVPAFPASFPLSTFLDCTTPSYHPGPVRVNLMSVSVCVFLIIYRLLVEVIALPISLIARPEILFPTDW